MSLQDFCMKSAMFTLGLQVTSQTNILNVIFWVLAHSEVGTAMIDKSQQQ